MCLRDSESGSVRRHRAHPEIGMGPEHCMAHRRIHGIDDADQSFGREDRTEPSHAGKRSRREDYSRLVADAAAVQSLRGNEAPPQACPESDQLPQPVVLPLERAGFHGRQRHAVRDRGFRLRHEERLTARLRAPLEHHERSQEGSPHRRGDRIAHRGRKSPGGECEYDACGENDQVDPGVAASSAGHGLPQVASTDQYFASSSRIRPHPRTTQVRGSSST